VRWRWRDGDLKLGNSSGTGQAMCVRSLSRLK
jgi:hypothetical protein